MADITVYCDGHGGCEVYDCVISVMGVFTFAVRQEPPSAAGSISIPFTQGNHNSLHLVLSANSATTCLYHASIDGASSWP